MKRRGMTILIYLVWMATLHVQDAAGQAVEIYQKNVSIVIEYGNAAEQVGFLRAAKNVERPPVGPESFFIDGQGNTYICDTVNQRIQVFSSAGSPLFTVELAQNVIASDIVADEAGNIYVYDDVHSQLLHYTPRGTLQHALALDPERWSSRGAMHLVRETLYMRTADQEDVPLATLRNGQMEAVSPAIRSQPLTKGIHGHSGRRYYVEKVGQAEGRVAILDESGILIHTIPLTIQQIASITFLQEDQAGNFYIQTERFVPPNVIVLEIHKFNSQGTLLSQILIPDNSYESWSVKLVDIRNNGDIHQLLPTQHRSYLNIFQPQQAGGAK